MSIIQGSAMQGATRGFYPRVIEGSLRFDDDDSPYLSWTPDSAGNRKTWTWSGWVKRGRVSGSDAIIFSQYNGSDNNNRGFIGFDNGVNLIYRDYTGGTSKSITSTAVFRDPSAWYHIVVRIDSTQATSSNRARIYVNGEQITAFGTEQYVSQNHEGSFNRAEPHQIGSHGSSSSFVDAYLADVHFVDGQSLAPSSFGELKNGVWVAKDYEGTYGTNGFLLTFEDDTEVEAFNTVLYRGDGSGNQSITGMGMNADLYWIKRRDAAGGWNCVDTVRGPHKRLELHGTGADYDQTLLQSFDSDGFTTGVTGVGVSGGSYVAFGWDAGANNAITGHSSVTYTGNGGTQRISGLPFRPDLVWIKGRSVSGENHVLIDSVRGIDKTLFSSYITGGEDTNTNRITSFDSNGFNIGTQGDINTSGRNYVAWAWDAGDGDPVSNTDGSITSTVKASTANGFSIVSYSGTETSGATIGHGLSSAPDMIIVKRRNATSSWAVYHSALDDGTSPENYYLYLNSTNAEAADSGFWNNTAPTSSVITLGSYNTVNGDGDPMIAYCWHDVTGKQKFSSYTGTGSDVTVNVGFRPGFLLVKWTGGGGASAENWAIVDASRDPINNLTKGLFPNTSGAEQDSATNNEVEFTSTGFVVKNTDARWNANGGTYIYAAFAGSYSDFITDYNTDGTNIDSRVKANQTTGFSICSYEGSGTSGDSFGHGLGTAPSWVIIKDRDSTNSWLVQHSSVTGYLTLNSTNAVAGSNQLTFGASTVTLNGTWDIMNGSGTSYIAYCWAEKTGYSKFSSYSGSGSAPSSLINTGFKPALVIIKESDGTDGWGIYDGTRNTSNPRSFLLQAQDSGAESSATANFVDFESNGFKVCTGGSNGNFLNESGKTYIYAAFADTREAAFWLDQSGNDNDWQPNNLDHNDTVADSPTDNFCTLNPLQGTSATYSNGNLRVALADNEEAFGTIAMTSGQWYWEVTYISSASSNNKVGLGIADADNPNNNEVVNSGHQATTYAVGDVIGVAVDVDAETISFYKNGTAIESDTSWSSKNWTAVKPFATSSNSAGDEVVQFNFGQQPFKYGPPE